MKQENRTPDYINGYGDGKESMVKALTEAKARIAELEAVLLTFQNAVQTCPLTTNGLGETMTWGSLIEKARAAMAREPRGGAQ